MADITYNSAQIAPVFPQDAEIFDMIAAGTITAGQAVYMNSSGKAALADADAGGGAEQFRGIALGNAGAGQSVSVLKRGHVYGFALSGVAYDGAVWLSNTAGALADAPSAVNPVRVGRAVALADANLTKVLYVDAQWAAPAQGGLRVFISTEQTGTGAAQQIPHGLGVTPWRVFVTPTDLTPAVTGSFAVTEGAHDATNVVVTVTSGKKFKVMAIAG
uniref:Uncharacterized protein n=1 Tax=Hot spring virus BHS1 TaxID=2024351 RepID=A0A2U7PIF6_9VIRU|nr:hypothetical protein [Hot spring virus BHS1]